MKLGLLFSGGKDSTYAGYLVKQEGHELGCLISIFSENKESYMFHTPSVERVRAQAEVMGVPLIVEESEGEKEIELLDLERGIKRAVDEFGIEGIVTGAVESVYQSSRIQKICDKWGLKCFNPLWKMDSFELLEGLIKEGFKAIVVGVFAYPLDNSWLGREIDKEFVSEVVELERKYNIHPAGEGGEFESFVLDCPLFSRGLEVKGFKDSGEKNSWRREVEV